MRESQLVVETVEIDSITPDPVNARKHDQRNLGAIAESLSKFGQRRPLVVTHRGVVIAGNGTLEAAKSLGWKQIAVTRTPKSWPEEKARAYALADNRTAELAAWDQSVLSEQLVELEAADWDMEALGFESSKAAGSTVENPDEIPAKAPAKTVRGDVWLLGEHRLMCGDSTIPTDVGRLMAGSKAAQIWTDPPYGVSYESAGRRGKDNQHAPIANDAMNTDDLENFLMKAFTNGISATEKGATWFVAAPAGPASLAFSQVLADLGIWKQMIVWVKDQIVFGRSDYHYRHESIYYGWTPGAAHREPTDRKGETVWEIPRPKKSEEHPTMKPVELVEKSIERHTNKGEIVLDLFGGSGTTLIAAQQLGRKACLMEFDERYCDIICARFQKATGIMPIAESTGNTHDFLNDADA